MSSPYTETHHALRATLRRFVEREIAPHVEAWDEAEAFPRDLYRKAGEVGLLGLGFPEALGGVAGDPFATLIACEEVARAGSGGVSAGLMSHGIALPPIVALGSEELRARVVPSTLRGETVAALAVTEPSGGSDVARLETRARRDGDALVIDGTKTFITSGMRADFLTVAVRTGGPGMGGISLVLVEGDRPGLSRTPLRKMGWWSSDTATLHLDGVRVPLGNVIGELDQGFLALMLNFNSERLGIAATALGFAEVCYAEALQWARDRSTFGKRLVDHQVIRHKLVDMRTDLEATRAFLERTAALMAAGESPVAELCMLKNQATRTLERCAKEAVQILGGAGYIRGVKSERIYRETKVLAIGGGAEEIMKELAARQLGF
jgi:acyl-CoA dehydrogenase